MTLMLREFYVSDSTRSVGEGSIVGYANARLVEPRRALVCVGFLWLLQLQENA